MISFAFSRGLLMMAYLDNTLGLNQGKAFVRDHTDITSGMFFGDMKPNSTISKLGVFEIIENFLSNRPSACIIENVRNIGNFEIEGREELIKACKNITGSKFYVLLEGRLIKCTKLPTLTNSFPLRMEWISPYGHSDFNFSFKHSHKRRIQLFCKMTSALQVKGDIRIKVVGEPFTNWKKYHSPLTNKTIIDESIKSLTDNDWDFPDDFGKLSISKTSTDNESYYDDYIY